MLITYLVIAIHDPVINCVGHVLLIGLVPNSRYTLSIIRMDFPKELLLGVLYLSYTPALRVTTTSKTGQVAR